MSKNMKKRVAWITFPACISTDIFIIPEVAKYYSIDWYIVGGEKEKIDFIDRAYQLMNEGILRFEVITIHNRLSNPKTALEYKRFIKRIKRENYDVVYNVMIGVPYYMPLLKFYIGSQKTLVAIHNVHVPAGGNLY